MSFPRKVLTSLILPPLLVAGALSAALTVPQVAEAVNAHSMTATHTWKGKVGTLHAMMGMHESFSFVVGSTTYTVNYTTHTRFAMGSAKLLKAPVEITVTGTLKGTIITATKLSV
jgi:opacity protein-like surface antigen